MIKRNSFEVFDYIGCHKPFETFADFGLRTWKSKIRIQTRQKLFDLIGRNRWWYPEKGPFFSIFRDGDIIRAPGSNLAIYFHLDKGFNNTLILIACF